MRLIVGVLACLSVGAISVAVAEDPPATSSATSPQAAAAPAAASTAAAPNTTVNVDAEQANMQEKHVLSEGYKMEMHNGEKYYCKRADVMGTRLGAGQKSCGTLQQVLANENASKEMTERYQRQQSSGPSSK
jgi:hypothetical protein